MHTFGKKAHFRKYIQTSVVYNVSCFKVKPCVCVCVGDAYYLAIGGGVAQHNWNHILTVLQDYGFNCTLTDHSEDMGMISIQGPKR